jgi:hypothetical protein
MAMIDPERERRRLAEFYSHQTEGELEETAKQADGLTDIAREVLRAELAKRALRAESVDETPKADQTKAEFRHLIVVRSYWNLLEAELAKGALDAAGIESFLFDDNMIRMDWFNANAIGGVKLRVDPENVEAANQILDECAANLPAGDESDSES